MNMTERILSAIEASGAEGITGAEIHRKTGIKHNTASVYVTILKASGQVFSAGPPRTAWVRHFVRRSDADAYEPIGQQLRIDSNLKARENQRIAQLARYHANPEKYNAATRKRQQEIRAKNPKPPKPLPKSKPAKEQPSVKAKRAAPDATFGRFAQNAEVDMSKAKVTVCPGFVPAHERPSETMQRCFSAASPGVYLFPPATCAARSV
jgi:hypothetical protein